MSAHTPNSYRVAGTNTFEYPSPAAVARSISAAKAVGQLTYVRGNKDWTGENGEESMRFAEFGDTSRVAAAEAILSQVERHIDLDTLRPSWEPCIAGAFPSVPDFVCGHPESMRRRVLVHSEVSPVRLMVCTTSSCSIEFEHLNARGTAILALAMALQMVRPVELSTFTALDGHKGEFFGEKGTGDFILKTRLSPSPFVLSEACWALTSGGFERNLAMSIGDKYANYTGGWAADIFNGNGDNRTPTISLRERLGATGASDLVIPPTQAGDQVVKQPVQWVIDRLTEYKSLMAEE